MGSHIDTTGFEKLRKRLKEGPEIQKLVPPTEFMRKFTDFDSMEDLVAASPFTAEQVRGFQSEPDVQWDEFIRAHTCLDSWQEFMQELAMLHLRKELPEFK